MEIKTALIEIKDFPAEISHGFGNGYIGVPKDHPWYERDYNKIECDVHGGLTYGKNHLPSQEPDGYWWIGFDTCHYQDDKYNCDKSYCEQEIESMKQQALKATV